MGSLIGGLVTKKKKKKLQGQLNQEYRNSAAFQAEGQRIEQLRANYGVRQEKIQTLREARIRRASILASAVNAGAGVSTVGAAGRGSAFTSAMGNIGDLNVLQTYSEEVSKQNEAYMKSQSQQQLLGAKINTQNEKAQFIGSIVDAGIGVATLPFGGGVGLAAKGFGAFTSSGVSAPITSLT